MFPRGITTNVYDRYLAQSYAYINRVLITCSTRSLSFFGASFGLNIFITHQRQHMDIHCRQLLIGHLTFFTLVQKVKIGHNNPCSYKQTKALPRRCKLFHSKMSCTFCIDDIRVMVLSFQKVTQFLHYKIFHRDIIHLIFCLFEVIPDCHDLRRINFKSFVSIGFFISST